MAKRLTIDGYGQLELNQVAFRRDGRIEAQCKLASGIEYVENGMLLAVDPAKREVKMPTGDDKFIALNYTTEHMYDERLAHGLKHFRLNKDSFLPRLGYLATGDKFTTNCLAYNEASYDNEDAVKAAVGTTLVYGKVCNLGAIELTADAEGAVVAVVEATTMPDGQFAVKFIAL